MGEIDWEKEYFYEHTEIGEFIIECPEGGYFAAGYALGVGSQSWLLEIDENGDSLQFALVGGESRDYILNGASVDEEGFILVGYTYSYSHDASADAWLVRMNYEGEIEWMNSYGGAGSDEFYSGVPTDDGGYILAGKTTSYGNGGDYYCVKTDEDGEQEWYSTWGYESADACFDITQTSEGGYALAGLSTPAAQGASAVLLDPEGEVVWGRQYRISHNFERIYSIKQLANGDFILGGEGYAPDHDSGIYLMRIDPEGNVIWNGLYFFDYRRRPGTCKSVFLNNDGSYTLAGDYYGDQTDFMLLRTGPDSLDIWNLPDTAFIEDENLEYDWEYFTDRVHSPFVNFDSLEITISGSEYLHPEIIDNDLLITPEPNWNGLDSIRFTVTTPEAEEENADTDTSYLRVTVYPLNDRPGNFSLLDPPDQLPLERWQTSFRWQEAVQNEWEPDTVRYDIHFLYNEESFTIENYPDTCYLRMDMTWLMDQLWQQTGNDDYLVEWWVTASDDSSFVNSTDHFTFIVPRTGVNEPSTENLPTSFTLYPPYPNPFNPVTEIRYYIPDAGKVKMSVYDVNGRLVNSLLDSRQEKGYHNVTWNASTNPAGVYFCRIEGEGFGKTIKLALVK